MEVNMIRVRRQTAIFNEIIKLVQATGTKTMRVYRDSCRDIREICDYLSGF